MRLFIQDLRTIGVAMLAFAAASSSSMSMADDPEPTLRIGMIGLDTSHVTAFSKILNDPNSQPPLKGAKVVAAFPAGSPDFPASRDRIEGFTKQVREMGVEIVGSIDELLPKVDAVLLMSVDGRVHLEQARPVLAAKKPMFIDKPLAADLADAIAIYDLAAKHETPVFSSSSSRFSPGYPELKTNDKVGEILGADVYGRTVVTQGHPDLFFYGIHGVELLYTMMDPGCESVVAIATPKYEQVTGVWSDGRIGTYRGVKEPAKVSVGATVFGTKGTAHSDAGYDYKPLVAEIVTFFRSGEPPVSPEETIEIFAFMTAAETSKAEG
ncbi:MAG: Gfo/Idh/MocA family oxidoreductase, partial [Planctomycetota bacterium]|nr:Gfo/Idh/MocA family oxidoreductase [Planctomycetota bacterium]